MLDTDKLAQKAQEALSKRNYDYAIDLAYQIIELNPGHPSARGVLRASQIKKLEALGKRPSAVVAVLIGLIPLIKIFILKTFKKPAGILNAAESFLKNNPYSVWVRTALGNALQGLQYIDSAVGEFEGIVAIRPSHLIALKALGELYHIKKDIKKSQHYYQMVLNVNPVDFDAQRALKDLAALTTLKEGGWSDARSARDVIKDKKSTAELEKGSQLTREADIGDEISALNAAVSQDPDSPDNVKHLKKIGELYLKQNNYTGAMDAYQKAYKLNPSDGALAMKVGDIKLLMFDQQINKIQHKLNAEPANTQLKDALQKARAEKVQFQIEEYARRVELHPTDLGLRFQLGAAFYAGGRVDEAVSEFQATVREPKRKLDSLNYLGRCFMAKKLYDMAISQFTKALESEAISNEQSKSIRYNLALAYESNKNPDKALVEYKSIMEVDINYKDVMKRVEHLQQR